MWDDHFAQRFAVSRQCPDARKEPSARARRVGCSDGGGGSKGPNMG